MEGKVRKKKSFNKGIESMKIIPRTQGSECKEARRRGKVRGLVGESLNSTKFGNTAEQSVDIIDPQQHFQ